VDTFSGIDGFTPDIADWNGIFRINGLKLQQVTRKDIPTKEP
jgi:hypothetical protein